MKIKSRPRENARKQKRWRHNTPNLQFLKQMQYFLQTGIWIEDPTRLHWHHRNPKTKFKKICRLTNRSPKRIAEELIGCDVVLDVEHRRIHERGNHGYSG